MASGTVPNSALAPITPAVASMPAVQQSAALAIDEGSPSGPSASLEVDAGAPPVGSIVRADETLRFGTRELPKALVATIVRAAATTGVDPTYLMALADKESSFRTEVRASTSSAEGLFQFIDKTWLETVQSYGGKHGLAREAAQIDMIDDKASVADPTERARILELRRDPYLAAVMAAEMLKRDGALIGFRIGRRLTSTEMYLAHFLGPDDAARFIELREAKRPQSATASFPAAARANTAIFFARERKRLRGLTVPEVYARLDQMIDSRIERFRAVQVYASAE